MPIRQATPTPIHEREEREQKPTRRSSFRCMGTGSDDYIRRMPILCALHRRLLEAHLDLPNAVKEQSVRTLPKIQNRSRKDNCSTCTMPFIGWRHVRTRDDSVFDPNRRGIGRTRARRWRSTRTHVQRKPNYDKAKWATRAPKRSKHITT